MLIRAKPDAVVGLDRLRALTQLQLSHCTSLRSIAPLPPALATLKIMKCRKLTSLGFLRDNPSIAFLYAATIDSLDFIPSMSRLAYLGFEKLGDGDLGPVLESESLRDVGFTPKKHYSHGRPELDAALARRRRDS